MENVYLVGSEDVQRAASTMQSAAVQMAATGAQIDESLRLFREFLDDWLGRLESALTSTAHGGR